MLLIYLKRINSNRIGLDSFNQSELIQIDSGLVIEPESQTLFDLRVHCFHLFPNLVILIRRLNLMSIGIQIRIKSDSIAIGSKKSGPVWGPKNYKPYLARRILFLI